MVFSWARPWLSAEMPFLSRALSANPDGLALEDGGRTWTYADLSQEAEKLARRLRTLGVGPGDVIGLAGNLDGPMLAALHGIWRAGGVAAPLNDKWTRDEKARALGLLDPFLILSGENDDGTEVASFASDDRSVFGLASWGDSALPSLADVPQSAGPLPELGAESDAARLLTSGTSGRPRVIRITVGNLRASARGARERLDLVPSDRWLGSLSLSHVGGVALVTRAADVGCGLVLRGPFNVTAFLELMEDGAFSHASLVPTMLHQALRTWRAASPPDSLRCLLIGGAPASEGLVRAALDAGFPIALTYGLTEAVSQVATAPPALVREKPGTVGSPLPGVTAQVSETGELLVRGPTVAPGQAAPDGWLHTGDLARVDADGHLWITGRLSDRIISGGVNVDPVEVERVLESHGEVEEAVVVGIPDPEWGERVVAVVVTRSSGFPFEGELEELARSTLSPAKRPRAFRFIVAVPRNPHGKVDRDQVRALFQ
jgi:O-succinylbenzoic acid--CoA ligase